MKTLDALLHTVKIGKDLCNPAPQSLVGSCHVFLRGSHDDHACTVVVLAENKNRLTVARASSVCQGLLAPRRSPKRQIKTWTCTRKELW